jgi:SAM-dependent methyltransferase
MTHSDIITLRNQLQIASSTDVHNHVRHELSKIFALIDSSDIFSPKSKQDLVDIQAELGQVFQNFDFKLHKLKSEIDACVEQQQRQFFQESAKRYEDHLKNRDQHRPGYVNLDRHLVYKLADEHKNLLQGRVLKYSSWKYPAMIIHPGQESFVDLMLDGDPLYLVDERHELLEPVLSKFNEAYVSRLRKYIITENLDNQALLGSIPNDQFGLCLMYNYLHWRPLHVIQIYLKELYDKLRAGGTLIITINDCDRAPGVKLVESRWCYYTPLSLVKQMALTQGYLITYVWEQTGGSMTWIELQKPGTLSSLRGGQALAQILPKPVAESK